MILHITYCNVIKECSFLKNLVNLVHNLILNGIDKFSYKEELNLETDVGKLLDN